MSVLSHIRAWHAVERSFDGVDNACKNKIKL